MSQIPPLAETPRCLRCVATDLLLATISRAAINYADTSRVHPTLFRELVDLIEMGLRGETE